MGVGTMDDLLLNSQLAKELYSVAKDLPIIDYHNHLSVLDIEENKRYFDIYELWIAPDPYKHRAMRMCGVFEDFITGNATNKEKFIKWCETVPKLIGNPLWHWSYMELSLIFGIDEKINGENAESLYNKCNLFLAENEITVSSLLDKFNVEHACPCASLIDDISCFFDNTRFAPSLRGDDIFYPTKDFIRKLSDITGLKMNSISDYLDAISKRLYDFKECGCSFSDHALDNGFKFYENDEKNDERFQKLQNGVLEESEKERLSSYILEFLGGQYAKLGFTMQLHIGAQRFTSTRLRELAGAAGGFASIGNSVDINSLTIFLDSLEKGKYGLPKTVIFTLNPADNALISVLSGSYSKDGVSGLITQGPAWWWCDHKTGITDVLENISVFGVLYNFIGMTTDSRSFLSFVRHDYFRRILCDWIAKKTENGDFTDDRDSLCELVKNLCYFNAKKATGGKYVEI